MHLTQGVQACGQNHQAGKYKNLSVLKREVSKFVFSVFPSLYFGPKNFLEKALVKNWMLI